MGSPLQDAGTERMYIDLDSPVLHAAAPAVQVSREQFDPARHLRREPYSRGRTANCPPKSSGSRISPNSMMESGRAGDGSLLRPIVSQLFALRCPSLTAKCLKLNGAVLPLWYLRRLMKPHCGPVCSASSGISPTLSCSRIWVEAPLVTRMNGSTRPFAVRLNGSQGLIWMCAWSVMARLHESSSN